MLVESQVSYREFITGRDVQDAVHYEDDTAGIVADISEDDVRPSDTVIDSTRYLQLATSIHEYNAALPELPRPISPREQLEIDFNAAATTEDRLVILANSLGLDI